jgi:citrate lyase subunit beta/citryl-CoA lyase
VLTAAAIADAVVIDLESIDPSRREAGRDALLAEAPRLHPPTTIVRISPMDTPDCQRDVAAVRAAGLTTVMLPRAESADQCEALAGLHVIAVCETSRGVASAPSIAAAANCIGLMWTVEAGVAGRDADGRLLPEVQASRHAVLSAARAAGVLAIDAAFPGDDDPGLRAEAEQAFAAGFDAKAVIHSSQVDIVQAADRLSHSPATEI